MITLRIPDTVFGSNHTTILQELDHLPMAGELGRLFECAKAARSDKSEGDKLEQALEAEELAARSPVGWERHVFAATAGLLKACFHHDRREFSVARTCLRNAWSEAVQAMRIHIHESQCAWFATFTPTLPT